MASITIGLFGGCVVLVALAVMAVRRMAQRAAVAAAGGPSEALDGATDGHAGHWLTGAGGHSEAASHDTPAASSCDSPSTASAGDSPSSCDSGSSSSSD